MHTATGGHTKDISFAEFDGNVCQPGADSAVKAALGVETPKRAPPAGRVPPRGSGTATAKAAPVRATAQTVVVSFTKGKGGYGMRVSDAGVITGYSVEGGAAQTADLPLKATITAVQGEPVSGKKEIISVPLAAPPPSPPGKAAADKASVGVEPEPETAVESEPTLSTTEAIDNICGKIKESNEQTRATFKHNAELKEQRAVYSWGSNDKGQLGRVSDTAVGRCTNITKGAMIVQVACGDEFSMAISNNLEDTRHTTSVWIWGSQKFDKTQRHPPRAPFPQRLEGLSDVTVTQIACGAFHTTITQCYA
jgi:hypothetical protein